MLVAVLALLVVLSLLAAAVALASQRAVAEAQTEIDRFEGEVDMVSTSETVLFMLSTQRQTMAGLTVDELQVPGLLSDIEQGVSILPVGNEIRLDGSPYRGIGNALFALQDDQGLISVNWITPSVLHRLYELRGVPQEQWAGLDAKRMDYQDPDSLHRLDGAEEPDYTKAGKTPPTNRAMVTPLELRRILGWDEMLAGMDDETLLGLFTMGRNSVINLNSVTRQVLAILPGMDEEQAERLVALRSVTPLTSTWDATQLFPGLLPNEDLLVLFSNPSGNLTLWDRRLGAKRLAHWTLTPFDESGRPWRIDYEVILPRGNQSAPAVARTPETPLFPAPDPAGE